MLRLTPTLWGDHSVGLIIDSDTGVHIEVPVSATVQEDVDGDGFGSVGSGGEDCNDADATVHPDATDTWYDGIDSDCAGDDDYDQDGDGVEGAEGGGDDCDDTDAATSPDLAELWYNGVDNDCAGDDDYDQDGDGHTSSAYTGDDCDDLDSDACPGAVDEWYDGVDSDCLGDNDYDQDLDGVEYPDDCNDTDPAVTGPVVESMNGIDDDCDGLIDDFEIGSVASGVMYGYATSMSVGDHGNLALADDVTGDGAVDLIIAARGSEDGMVWVVDAATAATAGGDEVRDHDTAIYSG